MLKTLIKQGNLKIGKDTLIFNMGSALECPSDKLGLCKVSEKCYAKKAEIQYKNTVPNYRKRQKTFWLNIEPIEFSEQLMQIILKKKTKIKFVRFNESGDFHSMDCIKKLIEIAKTCQGLPIRFYTYTARKDLIKKLNPKDLPKNLTINLSGFKKEGFNTFEAIKSVNIKNTKDYFNNRAELKKFGLPCIGDCSKCNLCKITHGKKIVIGVH